ncbi:putative uridine kinase [Golovinomyces cichoracearum]|uniref:Putative uridine kinase n=1 Tax=Golovinomyces cichoracearum TaxID=62708 RepID=A0A420J6V1_9PEZI|nr:putative uridine kinase [Golovinomyces cichoracearum]
MEEQIDCLIGKLLGMYGKVPPIQRLIIAITGIPGSGKTTLAAAITSRINLLHPLNPEKFAICIPMDGFHFTRAQLDTFPDPEIAHARRGAAFTFNTESISLFLHALRQPLTPRTKTLFAPSFSHILKDPVPDDIAISPATRIIIFEGNYLAFDMDPWRGIASLFDERWFLKVDFDIAEKRLIARHLAAGIVRSEQDARSRVHENDLINGKEIVEYQYQINEVIVSKEDEGLKK